MNPQVLQTVDWLAQNKTGLGYDLHSRFTEDLKYGDTPIRSRNSPATMCVAAVYEVLVRTIDKAKTTDGKPASDLLKPSQVKGNSALALEPYIFQFRSSVNFSEYGRKFSAGAGDAFVLFGIGRYVKFEEAKPGDFLYFNRNNGGGHAVVFMGFLDSAGKLSESGPSAAGFRYFSAQQGGTHGMGYRDAFFGKCPVVETKYVKDCGVKRSDSRATLSVARLHAPDEWFAKYSAIRVDRFLLKHEKIDAIYADEARFRTQSVADLEEAQRIAAEKARQGLFPLIVPKVEAHDSSSRIALVPVKFTENFGPNFSEASDEPEPAVPESPPGG
jgi:hypothetical protein